jgi:hypothetical protein
MAHQMLLHDAGEERHLDVEHDAIGERSCVQGLQSVLAVASSSDLVSGRLQELGRDFYGVRAVVYDENVCHWLPLRDFPQDAGPGILRWPGQRHGACWSVIEVAQHTLRVPRRVAFGMLEGRSETARAPCRSSRANVPPCASRPRRARHALTTFLGAGPRELEVRSDGQQRFDRRVWPRLGGDPRLELANAVGERVDVEGRSELPLAVADVQEAVVEQVVVHVRDQDGERDAPPKLVDVRLGGGAVDAEGVDDLGVVVLAGIAWLGAQHRGGRRVEQPAAAVLPIEARDQRDRDTVAVDQTRLGRLDAGSRCEAHREDLSLRHGTLVRDARELADAEPPRLVDHRALGSQAAEGRAAPAQVREVGRRLGVGLDGA